ncbi:Kcnh2 [Symbiodinium necroappetens]|uniref:Kcnh2 protein n=1 Tax=Symbiodinium necroappetens TaxID=1628268 RepID=A0A812NYT8_9DINO|nr:Kcnh2 [Symbiodinium necroappetens]
MPETWRRVLASLTEELEQMSDTLRDMKRENDWLRDLCALQGTGSATGPVQPAPPSTVAPPSPPSIEARKEPMSALASRSSSTGAGDDTVSTSASRPSKSAEESDRVEELHPNYISEESSDPAVPVFEKLVRRVPSEKITGSQSRFTEVVGLSKKLANPRIDFMILRAQKTKQFKIEKPWYIINPDNSSWFTVWQGLMCLALTFVALITPVQVGLIEEFRFDALAMASLCADGIFLVDLFMQFCTTYSKKTVCGTIWETRVSAISQRYLKSWFVLDVTSLIPFDLIGLTIGGSSGSDFGGLKSIKVLRVLRLLKLARLLKTSKLMHRLEIPVAIPYQHLALIRFMFVLMMACHWLACLWAMTLQLVDAEFPRWINDIEASDLEFGIESSRSPLRIYIAAFYFCSYTMTSVGYGDIGPKNILERLVCCGIVLSAGLCWAYVLGEVCGIVADMTSESQDFRKRMCQLNCMMKEQGLPGELKARLRSFFLQNRHQSQFLTQQTLLQDMSPQLQSEVSTVLNWTWIQKVTFFSQFLKFLELQEMRGVHVAPYMACIADIAKALKASAFAQRESFDNVQVLYILSKGLVALDSRVAYNGAVWGEDFVLSDTSLIRPVAGYALTYIEVLYLTRDALMEVIARRKASCPQLGRIVRQYCVRVAVFRGILAEAKRRSKLSAGESPNPVGGSGPPQKHFLGPAPKAFMEQSRPRTSAPLAQERSPRSFGFGSRPVQQDVVAPGPPPRVRSPWPKPPLWEVCEALGLCSNGVEVPEAVWSTFCQLGGVRSAAATACR